MISLQEEKEKAKEEAEQAKARVSELEDKISQQVEEEKSKVEKLEAELSTARQELLLKEAEVEEAVRMKADAHDKADKEYQKLRAEAQAMAAAAEQASAATKEQAEQEKAAEVVDGAGWWRAGGRSLTSEHGPLVEKFVGQERVDCLEGGRYRERDRGSASCLIAIALRCRLLGKRMPPQRAQGDAWDGETRWTPRPSPARHIPL